MASPIKITELVLRDSHQSLLATRMRIEDMLPIANQLDAVGYWSLETWGGATFDACIRYLGEDPWERLRTLKQAMPNTPQQMLFRAQNILGYRHYADDVVDAFVERCADNGIDIFRIFDALNDLRNFETAVNTVKRVGKHAQGAMSYTVSPAHTVETWVDMGKRLEDMGCHSICIKDMAGLLKPFDAEKIIHQLKNACDVPIALHSHATTGMSVATLAKAVEAGVDMIDTAISSMSMTYSHSPTETMVAIFQGTERDSNLDLAQLEDIATYFRNVRKKYALFEGSLKGVDARILLAQVPGGMLTNMEKQLIEQGAGDQFDAVLAEIPKVREDLGNIPLVTPTSQIVGTQAVLNVVMGERYKSITKETAGVLKGEYGQTPSEVNPSLQARVLEGNNPIRCRPADLIEPEMESLTQTLKEIAQQKAITLAEEPIDDVLTYALFPQVGLHFLENRHNPSAFEGALDTAIALQSETEKSKTITERYSVVVNGHEYDVSVSPHGSKIELTGQQEATSRGNLNIVLDNSVQSPLAGNVLKILVKQDQIIAQGDVVLVLEAMKMETEVRANCNGKVTKILVEEGMHVTTGQDLLHLS